LYLHSCFYKGIIILSLTGHPMRIQHGFHATITALPGRGGALADLLLAAPALTEPDCVVFLVGRSAADPDIVHVTEGWTSREAHSAFFAGDAAKTFTARLAPLVAGEATYTDETPLGGKAFADGGAR
jgi:quinol monooxygenase YgiN